MATPKKKLGRPTEYDEKWHCAQVRHAAFLGYNNREIARLLGISEDTLYTWKKEKPAFSEAIWHGENTDVQNLTKSLTKRATGFTYKEVKKTIAPASIEYRMVPDADKPGELKEVEVHLPERVVEKVETTKVLPPDVGALRFAMTNRDAARWRESAHIDHTTNGKDLDGAALDLSKLSDEEIQTLARLEAKARGIDPENI